MPTKAELVQQLTQRDDELAQRERELAAYRHMKANTVDLIRKYAGDYGFDFCDNGLQNFCDELGVDFRVRTGGRRVMFYVDIQNVTETEASQTIGRIVNEIADDDDTEVGVYAVWASGFDDEHVMWNASNADPTVASYGLDPWETGL